MSKYTIVLVGNLVEVDSIDDNRRLAPGVSYLVVGCNTPLPVDCPQNKASRE